MDVAARGDRSQWLPAPDPTESIAWSAADFSFSLAALSPCFAASSATFFMLSFEVPFAASDAAPAALSMAPPTCAPVPVGTLCQIRRSRRRCCEKKKHRDSAPE
jgi:hypothetical protein